MSRQEILNELTKSELIERLMETEDRLLVATKVPMCDCPNPMDSYNGSNECVYCGKQIQRFIKSGEKKMIYNHIVK